MKSCLFDELIAILIEPQWHFISLSFFSKIALLINRKLEHLLESCSFDKLYVKKLKIKK